MVVDITPSNSLLWQRISVVTVAYNSSAVIGPCLKVLAGARHIIVVDNASTDDTVSLVRKVVPHAEIMHAECNLGYGRGVNTALKQVTTEFVLLITPDTVVEEKCVHRLLRAADLWSNVGMVGPALTEPSGRNVRCHDAALFHRGRMSRSRDGEPFPDGPLCAGYIQNAVILVRMAAFQEVGFYDSNIFLFYEDDDLCLRFIQKGWTLILLPDVTALHIVGSSSLDDNKKDTRLRYYHMAWSRIYLERKHRGQVAALIMGTLSIFRFASKILAALVTFDCVRFTRDTARLKGSVAGLLGRSAFHSKARQ